MKSRLIGILLLAVVRLSAQATGGGSSVCTLSGSQTTGYVLTAVNGSKACSWQAAGSATVDANALKNAWVLTDSGTANAIVGSTTTTFPAAYALGQTVIVDANATNTGATTINIHSLGAKNVTKAGSTALAAGDKVSGQPYILFYDGTEFQMLNPSNSVTTNGANSLTGSYDFSNASNVLLPSGPGESTTEIGQLFQDALTGNWHTWGGPAFSKDLAIPMMDISGLNNGHCVAFSNTGSLGGGAWTLNDVGFGCLSLPISWTYISSGTNTVSVKMGAGGSLSPTSSGIVQANQISLCPGTANSGTAETCSTTPSMTLATNDSLTFINGTAANTGSFTIAVNGGSALTVKKQGCSANLVANDILASQQVLLTYNGTNLCMQGQTGNLSTTVNGQTCTIGSSCTIPLSAVNPQTATYQVLATDFSNYKTITVASGTFAVTMVASTSQPAAGQYIRVINYGSGTVTIARSGQNINGGTSSLTLAAASATAPTATTIVSDGTNYFASLDGGSSSGAITYGLGTWSTFSGLTCNSTLNETFRFTNSYFTEADCLTGASSWTYLLDGKQAYPPAAAANWTVVNGASGTATLSNSNGAVVLATTSDVLGVESALKAIPSAPYTKTLAVRFYLGTSNSGAFSQNSCGVVWANGTATSSSYQMSELFFSSASANSYVVSQYATLQTAHATSYTGSRTVDVYRGITSLSPTATVWFQLIDDNTNRSVNVSVDGVNWVALYPATSRTSPFTPTYYGIACGAYNAGGGVPWSITLLSDN